MKQERGFAANGFVVLVRCAQIPQIVLQNIGEKVSNPRITLQSKMLERNFVMKDLQEQVNKAKHILDSAKQLFEELTAKLQEEEEDSIAGFGIDDEGKKFVAVKNSEKLRKYLSRIEDGCWIILQEGNFSWDGVEFLGELDWVKTVTAV